MSEKMLVTQALDEKDLLVKKITDKISKASFVDIKKNNEDKAMHSRQTEGVYRSDVEASYQQIIDLISRFQRLDVAIVESNANTKIETSFGTFTVAGAIALRSRMKGMGAYGSDADFEDKLCRHMESERNAMIKEKDQKNQGLQATAESMRLSILGKDSKAKDDKPLAVVDTYVKENTTELVDPLDTEKKITDLRDKRNKLLQELETRIKVSNATTFIEI